MTKSDAETFKVISGFVINNDFVFYDASQAIVDGPLAYNNMLHLQDCGLVNVGPNLVKSIKWLDTTQRVFRFHLGAIMIDKGPDDSEKIEIPEVLLTTAGRELCRLIPTTFQLEYLRGFSTFLKTKKCSLSYLEGGEFLPDGSFSYFKQTPIEPHST